MPNLSTLIRAEWATFRERGGRLIAVGTAMLIIALFGLVPALTSHSSCSEGKVEVACPTDPVGPDGRTVGDKFFFANRPLDQNGGITVRMTSMTGTITYPPPDHDEIVAGLVPWAKAGIIIKDGVEQGSAYAALMMTGNHGVRMQYNYIHDTAGSPGGVSTKSPRWLRLTRSGDMITGYESADGRHWSAVDTVRLPGLPPTVRVGLFATSPGDLTLRTIGLGGRVGESRFTQATGVFDHVTLDRAATGEWSRDTVGELGHTDWEKHHRAAGLVAADDGTLSVTGSGDIGPIGTEGGKTVRSTLTGLAAGLIVLIVMAVRYARAPGGVGAATPGRALAARASLIGTLAFLAGLVAAAITVPVGTAVLRSNGIPVIPSSTLTDLRVIIGAAGLAAVVSVFALALGMLTRRWAALLVALSAVVLSYVLAVLPLLPEGVSDWLLRLTPAAGFAVLQTLEEYPQVVAHYAAYAGYFPLPGWAGFAITCGYAALALWLALHRLRNSGSDREATRHGATRDLSRERP